MDYSSEPFNSIHNIKEKNIWIAHYKKEILPLVKLGHELHLSLSKDYGLILPKRILDVLDKFSQHATRMAVEAYHFDGSIIIERQGRMEEARYRMLNEMRTDLGVDLIDKSLSNRLKEKTR